MWERGGVIWIFSRRGSFKRSANLLIRDSGSESIEIGTLDADNFWDGKFFL